MQVKLYRILTGKDDAALCHRITDALNKGWELYGSPTMTYDPERKIVVAGQAVVKEKLGEYNPDMKLSEQ